MAPTDVSQPTPAALRIDPVRVAVATLLVLIPITAACGPYLLPINVGGVTLYAFRTIVLCALPLLLTLAGGRVPLTKSSLWFFSTMYAWLVWGSASLLWTPDPRIGATEVITLVFGSAAALVVVLGCELVPNGIEYVRRGWLLAYLASAAVAVWELRTHQHLQSSFTERTPDYAQGVLVSTFGNPNNYAAFIVLAFPFLLWSAATGRG